MGIHKLIYRKQLIESVLHSFRWEKEKISTLLMMVNSDREFLKSCIRTYRGKLSITKRIERIRSGNKIY